MLPLLHFQGYGEFLGTLEELKKSVATGTDVKIRFQQVQHLYQEKILMLTIEGIDPAIALRWRSLQTEINRAMRLLQTDVLFLGASRQAAIAQQRQVACLARIEQLIGYCQLLLTQPETT